MKPCIQLSHVHRHPFLGRSFRHTFLVTCYHPSVQKSLRLVMENIHGHNQNKSAKAGDKWSIVSDQLAGKQLLSSQSIDHYSRDTQRIGQKSLQGAVNKPPLRGLGPFLGLGAFSIGVFRSISKFRSCSASRGSVSGRARPGFEV